MVGLAQCAAVQWRLQCVCARPVEGGTQRGTAVSRVAARLAFPASPHKCAGWLVSALSVEMRGGAALRMRRCRVHWTCAAAGMRPTSLCFASSRLAMLITKERVTNEGWEESCTCVWVSAQTNAMKRRCEHRDAHAECGSGHNSSRRGVVCDVTVGR